MDSVTVGLIVGQLVTFLSVVVATAFQYWRENRNRRWEQEDKAQLARTLALEVKATAQVLANKVESVADALVATTAKQAEKISTEIQENTKISTKAFHEANTVNLKLEKLGLAHNALQEADHRKDG